MSVISEHFADWFLPSDFGMGAELMQKRQQVVESLAPRLQNLLMLELVRLVFARPSGSPEALKEFRQLFKNADATFRMSGNDAEVLSLAGCVLAAVLTSGSPERVAWTAVAILSASVARTKTPSLRFDLIGMAESALSDASRKWRERPNIASDPKAGLLFSKPEGPTKEDAEASEPTVEEALEDIATLGGVHNALVKQHQDLVRLLAFQDEELEVLWWLVTGWSTLSDRPFDQLSEDARPVVLAAELANKSKQNVEMPSLGAIFSRAGVDSRTKITIPVAVNACNDWLVKIATAKKTCPSLTPIRLALERASETGAGPDWIAAWSAVTGLQDGSAIDSVDIAVQLYREFIVSKWIL